MAKFVIENKDVTPSEFFGKMRILLYTYIIISTQKPMESLVFVHTIQYNTKIFERQIGKYAGLIPVESCYIYL